MVRAVRCHDWGTPEGLRLEEIEAPRPGPGEVAIEVAVAGLNFADVLMIAGQYQDKPALPFSPGLESAGRVRELGPGVEGFAPGDRVMAFTGHGAFAEVALAASADLHPIPEAMDFETAAAFGVTYGTAHGALTWHADLQPGETLLVHGAAGGVGLAAVEVGKALGARVIATAGGPEKLAVARAHGADELVDYRSEDIRARVKGLTEGRGADVVFDPVGGKVFEASLRCVAWGGRLLVIGFAGGTVQQIPANLLLVKNVAAMGVYWGSNRKFAPARVTAQFVELFAWYQQGKLKPHVSHRLDLAEATQALTLLTSRQATGKVVLTTGSL